MKQSYEENVCVTQSHPLLTHNSLIFILRYVVAQKSDEVRKYTAFKLDKPVIGYRIGKLPMQVHSDIMQVVMFEVGERTEWNTIRIVIISRA